MTIERLLIGLYVCTIPLLTVGVTQFRPDPFWGIVLGGAMGLLLTEPMVGASTRHLIAVGASFGAACLIKTSTFPVTAAALCAGVVLGAIADRYARPADWSWRAAIRSALIICATAALVVLPYYALAWRKIFDYIYINALGRDVYIWLTPGDLVAPPHLLQLRGCGHPNVWPPSTVAPVHGGGWDSGRHHKGLGDWGAIARTAGAPRRVHPRRRRVVRLAHHRAHQITLFRRRLWRGADFPGSVFRRSLDRDLSTTGRPGPCRHGGAGPLGRGGRVGVPLAFGGRTARRPDAGGSDAAAPGAGRRTPDLAADSRAAPAVGHGPGADHRRWAAMDDRS